MMWVWLVVGFVGLAALTAVLVLLEVRRERSVGRQLTELAREVWRLRAEVGSLNGTFLASLLPESCYASMGKITAALLYYRKLEEGCTDEELRQIRVTVADPFGGALTPGREVLPSQALSENLAALRAIMHRYHSSDPVTFSREVSWIYPPGTPDEDIPPDREAPIPWTAGEKSPVSHETGGAR